MAIENKYGKSAVDATRKNTLPPWLDTVLGTSGAFLPLTGGTLTGELTISATNANVNSSVLTVTNGQVEVQNGDIIIGNSNNNTEMDLFIRNKAGEIALYAAATSTGNRGLWVEAHGTGTGYTPITIDTNNNSAFRDRSSVINLTSAPSSTVASPGGYYFLDGSGTMTIGGLRTYQTPANVVGIQLYARRTVGSTTYFNSLSMALDTSGNPSVTLHANSWKNALGISKVINQATTFTYTSTNNTLVITNS